MRQARGEAPEAKAALSELCEAYYNPVLRFLLREGKDGDQARELTQAFFNSILSRNNIQLAEPGKGRFRSYLLGALKHFLADLRRHQSRQKRGGDAQHQSLDETSSEGIPDLQISDPSSTVPDSYFDREWALALIDRSLKTIEASFAKKQKLGHFETLKPWLTGDADTFSQAEAATTLRLSPGAIKVAIHRLRQDFNQSVRAEIAQIVTSPDEINDELNYLIQTLSSGKF